MDRRNWTRLAEHYVEAASKGQVPVFRSWLTEAEKVSSPFPIFTANLSNVGILEPVCSEIGKFYISVTAIRTTVAQLQDGDTTFESPEQCKAFLEDELDFWRETVVVGRRTVVLLRKL